MKDARLLSIACVLIYNPKIIVLDEVTSGLSSTDKKDLIRLFKLLKNKYNKTIILLTKDTSFAYELTDFVYLMHLTRIVSSGKRDLLETYDLNSINLEIPKIVSFINTCNKKGHEIRYCNNILDLIKEVYRDVF